MRDDVHPRCPAALLWDFDGTIGDTEPMWWRAEARFMADLGVIESDDEGRARVGQSLETSVRQMLARADRPDLSVDASGNIVVTYMLDLLRDEGVTYLPGTVALLAEAAELGLPCALVSQTHGHVLQVATSGLPRNTFGAIVGGERVTHTKPHPEPFLLAAELLGVNPVDCLVIEDSPAGLRSAAAAGMAAIGVPSHAELVAGTRQRLVPSLDRVTLADVCRIWTELVDA